MGCVGNLSGWAPQKGAQLNRITKPYWVAYFRVYPYPIGLGVYYMGISNVWSDGQIQPVRTTITIALIQVRPQADWVRQSWRNSAIGLNLPRPKKLGPKL